MELDLSKKLILLPWDLKQMLRICAVNPTLWSFNMMDLFVVFLVFHGEATSIATKTS